MLIMMRNRINRKRQKKTNSAAGVVAEQVAKHLVRKRVFAIVEVRVMLEALVQMCLCQKMRKIASFELGLEVRLV